MSYEKRSFRQKPLTLVALKEVTFSSLAGICVCVDGEGGSDATPQSPLLYLCAGYDDENLEV